MRKFISNLSWNTLYSKINPTVLCMVLAALSEILTNLINNPVNVNKGFLMSKQVEYVGLVTTVIECRVLNMTEEATNM